MSGHIFISYHHEDGDFAENLCSKLSESGLGVWMDEVGLIGGDEWREEIDKAIRGASALVLIVTPESKESFYVTYEWIFALGAGVKVVPIKLKETEPHPRLQDIHHHDFTNRRARPWEKLLGDLKEICTQRQEEARNLSFEAIHPCTIKIPENVPDSFKQAVMKLDSTNEYERKEAIEFIGGYDHPAALEVLLSALKHPLVDIRVRAIQLLKNIQDQVVLPALLKSLNDKSVEVRKRAIMALVNLKDANAVPGLVGALTDESSSVRIYAADGLAEFKDVRAVPALIDALKDENEMVGSLAANALGEIKDVAALPALIAALGDKKMNVSGSAARVLVEIGESSIALELINALKGEDKQFKAYAAWILGELKVSMAIQYLIELLSDESNTNDQVIRKMHIGGGGGQGIGAKMCDVAAEALTKIGTPKAISAVEEWQKKQSSC